MKPTIHTTQHFHPAHPPALAIYCSDGRFTRAVEELLASLGHPALDTLTMPGGPGLLVLSSALPSDRDAVGRAARFLIRGHELAEVVLLAHEGCGYYRARHPNRLSGAIRDVQVADLKSAAHLLRLEHPSVKVSAYFARVLDGRIGFDPVAT